MEKTSSPFASLVAFLAFYVTAFAFMYATIPVNNLIVLLNGLLYGALVALAFIHAPIAWRALSRRLQFFDVGQFTLSLFMLWFTIYLAVSTSVYINSSDETFMSPLFGTALGRWTGVCAAVLQAYAPDPGLGLFRGRDRRVAISGMLIGVLVSAVVVYLQEANALS